MFFPFLEGLLNFELLDIFVHRGLDVPRNASQMKESLIKFLAPAFKCISLVNPKSPSFIMLGYNSFTIFPIIKLR